MIQTTTQKITVIMVSLILLSLLGYFIFSTTDIPTTPADEFVTQEVIGQDILVLADKVQNISIDQRVFESIVFQSLVDYELPLQPEEEGRPNPFAPLEGGSTRTVSSPR